MHFSPLKIFGLAAPLQTYAVVGCGRGFLSWNCKSDVTSLIPQVLLLLLIRTFGKDGCGLKVKLCGTTLF